MAADASVRIAGPNDAPAVGVVQAAVFSAAYADRLPAEVLAAFQPAAFARAWAASLREPLPGIHRLLVACAGAQVVGVAAVGPAQDPDAESLWAEVSLLGVHPQARHQGHGSRLLQAAVDTVTQAGASDLAVWLPADDEETRRFLEAAGFGPDGAYRDRLVAPPEGTLREVRLRCGLVER